MVRVVYRDLSPRYYTPRNHNDALLAAPIEPLELAVWTA
jgi:hypothetical protein